jgi:hypothetical protein
MAYPPLRKVSHPNLQSSSLDLALICKDVSVKRLYAIYFSPENDGDGIGLDILRLN